MHRNYTSLDNISIWCAFKITKYELQQQQKENVIFTLTDEHTGKTTTIISNEINCKKGSYTVSI